MTNPTVKSTDPYGGVALGVEAAWPQTLAEFQHIRFGASTYPNEAAEVSAVPTVAGTA